MNELSLLIGLGAALGVIIIWYGASHLQTGASFVSQRLANFDKAPQVKTLSEIELSQPFSARFLQPFFERLGKRMASLQPTDQAKKLQALIELAGSPLGLNADSFRALQMVMVVVGVLLGVLLWVILQVPLFMSVGFFVILGYVLPQYQLKRIVSKRQHEIFKALPNALDLLCISVEAGLGFDAALSRVTEKFHNALSDEFNEALNEIRLGRSRHDALTQMGKRSGVPELNAFLQALVQSDQLGVGIAKVLRIQSDEMRRRRRQKAEAKAQQASLKMLFPMVLLIFPVLFIVLLGPAAINLIFHIS